MAKFTFDIGDFFTEEQQRLAKARAAAVPVCKAALYEGAKVTADAVHAAASAHGTLANGLDLSKMETDTDGADIALGFGGYDANGTPYKLIANVLESGNSRTGTAGTHFFTSAFNKSKAKAIQVMQQKYWEVMDKILNE